MFALAGYFLDDWGELIRFHKLTLDKKFMEENIDYCIIKDLKALHTNCRLSTNFKTVFEYNFDIQHMKENRVMSQHDFGFLFSLVSVAFKTREELQNEVSWSGELQQLYLRKLYKKMLRKIEDQRFVKCNLSIFEHIYETCSTEIEIRVFSDIVQSFDRCPYSKLE